MKTIRKNFLLLAFAAGALFLIGNNVMADPTTIIAAPDDQGGGGTTPVCTVGGPGVSSCSVSWSMGFLGFTFSGGCSVTCDAGYYACCHTGNNTCQCFANN
jgi:hypothetical protein